MIHPLASPYSPPVYILYPPSYIRLHTSVTAGMRTPTQQELMDSVKVADWYPFALSLLKGDDQTVNMIEKDSALSRTQDKLKEVFKVWIDESEKPTWNDVVGALRHVKNNRLAREIKSKFC